jgi:ParB/RepB/Spo0J family partition protein
MYEISINQIRPSPYQLRLTIKVEDLKEEIQRDGLLSPLIVRRKNGYYELIDGQRRLEALKELGWKKIPVEIQEVEDKKARLMVYKLNSIREGYTVEEKARYFKRLHDEGMTFYQIAKDLSLDDQWVLAHINVFLFPEDIQNAVWEGQLSIKHIRDLEPVIGANIQDATKIAREIILRKLSTRQAEELIKPRREAIEKARVEAAKEAIGAAAPISVKLETPEDLEKAAETLRKEATRRREETLTPEEKVRREAEKKRKEEERRKRAEERKKHEEEERRKREETERQRLEEEMKRKLEEEKHRLEEEVRAKAKEELLKDREFVREFIAKEYPRIHEALDVDDLRELLMRRLMANIPEEKRSRAENIFKEEWGSLEKRINIFPEKSARMEPKLDRLRQLEEEGVFLTTLWDIGERADYAGKGDFHGNCPPQVVENCVLRLTKKGELVVDPMAGSGTTVDVCKILGRKCIAYDIKPPKWRDDIILNDSRKIPLEDEHADMVFLHPPYWDMVYYTDTDERLPDLSRAKTLNEYSDMLRQVLRECYRILKGGKFLCILLGDRIKDGRFIPLCRKAANLAEEIGFTDCGYAVKFTKGSTSLVVKGKTIYAELAYTENLKIDHDLVLFFRKGR